MATKRQDFFMPNSGYWGTRALVKVMFLSCKWEWRVPQETPKGLCLITLSPFPFTLSHLSPNPNPCETAMLRVLASIGRANLREEAGGGNPSIRRCGDQVTSQCSSRPKGPPSLGCTRLGFAVEGLPESGDSSREFQTLWVQCGLISWHMLPSSLSPQTV